MRPPAFRNTSHGARAAAARLAALLCLAAPQAAMAGPAGGFHGGFSGGFGQGGMEVAGPRLNAVPSFNADPTYNRPVPPGHPYPPPGPGPVPPGPYPPNHPGYWPGPYYPDGWWSGEAAAGATIGAAVAEDALANGAAGSANLAPTPPTPTYVPAMNAPLPGATSDAAIGSYVYSVPMSCAHTLVNAVTYVRCGATWYLPQFSGGQVVYQVVAAPN